MIVLLGERFMLIYFLVNQTIAIMLKNLKINLLMNINFINNQI